MTQPLVSILTPAYNRASFLDETIESVLAQDYPNLEHIVLDDGSTDHTPSVLAGYAGKIQTVRHENRGEQATVNRGLELARGTYVCVVNSDDPLLPGAISAAVEVLEGHPGVVAAYPDWELIDDRGERLALMRTPEYSPEIMIAWHFCIPGAGTLFRRDAALQIGGRDESFRYVSDYDLWLRLSLVGELRRIPLTLATWRNHASGATTADRGFVMAMEHVRVIEKLYARDDLPADILGMRREAFRNAFYVAGHACGPVDRDQRERFHWGDRMLTMMHGSEADVYETVTRLHGVVAEHAQTVDALHAEVAERDKTIEWLHSEVARRDQAIVDLQATNVPIAEDAPHWGWTSVRRFGARSRLLRAVWRRFVRRAPPGERT